MIIARKRFGQNFLIDPRKAKSLVNALEIESEEAVLEIGPGTGMLTERILAMGARLTAVELDRELVPGLLERFGGRNRFRLIVDDIVNVDPADISPDGMKVIGNLPYNISGAVVDWLIEKVDSIKMAVITLQKEVADRLRAEHGCRDYGSSSVLIQSFFRIVRLFDIPPGCFSPRPKVKSSVLRLIPDKGLESGINYPDFRDFVRACFHQKRKKITNSLASSAGMDKAIIENHLAAMGKTANCRAEELTLAEFYRLYKLSG